ncbi:hypothetical protein [Nocardia huaxiensis]|uniref:Uncharacterized protein n=1 Tax=Nocardia huaxiensis TaxID=2755382 RepID=A0A7D6V9I0_9NOCA|nr:hypothetical protein [Nocardia huaxiensis]QLY31092.1 hypothetical protein H0264_01455 [Nocardia huaxiensis]UFS94619.1 hypothetical protein LPY97_28300 [Nocardia huaxiensis]
MTTPPVPQLPMIDVYDLLNGAVDMRMYTRRILVLKVRSLVGGYIGNQANIERQLFPPIIAVADAVEWLESQGQGWRLVSITERPIEGISYWFAFLRRDQP